MNTADSQMRSRMLNILKAKAVGLAQGVQQFRDKMSSSPSLQYGKDYDVLVREVKIALPDFAKLLPPEAKYYRGSDGADYVSTPYVEIGSHCLQLIEILQTEIRDSH